MGTIFRAIVALPFAAVIVVGIYLGMARLIAPPDELLDESTEPPDISIGRQLEDTDITNQRRFERPQLDTPPPPPPAINQANFQPSVDGVSAQVPSFETNVNIGSAFNPDRDAQPIVRIPPQVSDFQRCIRSNDQRTERVRLRFDVTPQGEVVNVEVIDSTDSCYNRASIRSAQRWKYNPKIEDGEPQPRFGVETTIRFDVGGG